MAEQVVYPPPSEETRETVLTDQAAFYLQLRAKTLRDKWAGKGKGPISPKRVGGRLHWPMADIRRVLGVGGAE